MKNYSSPLTTSSGNTSGEHPPALAQMGRGVLWLQVCALAAVQGAITLTWVIYRLYLPQLLTQFGFPAALAASLLIIENLLAVVMEPLMGGMSDQAKRWVGTRFPFISVGVILSSVLFIAIPTVVIFGNPTDALRWVLPIVLIAWALAMTVFRSPAVSLLNQYAAPEALPLAASLLTLSGGLIGAFASFSHQLVLGWGPAVTFAIASFVLLGAVALLRFVHPPETSALSVQSPESSQLPTVYSLLTALQLIFVTGISVTWGSRFLMNTLQKVVKNQLSAADVEWVMFAVAIALALAALPAGALAVWLGNQRAMLIGIGATVGLMWLIALIPSWVIVVIVVIALVAAFSLIVNGVIPYALSLVPPQRSGVGVGIYFAGAAASAGLFEVAFPQSSLMTPIIAALLGTLAFLAAGLCIVASTKIGRSPSHR